MFKLFNYDFIFILQKAVYFVDILCFWSLRVNFLAICIYSNSISSNLFLDLSGKVEAPDSLFHHHISADQNFKPDNTEKQLIPHNINEVCGKGPYSDLCKHDYIVSNDTNVASVSKRTIDMYEFLVNRQKVGKY